MLGKSHVTVNVCTFITLSNSTAMITKAYKGAGSTQISNVLTSAASYFQHTEPLNKYFFVGLSFVFFILGSLLPDIDCPTSTLGRIIYIPVEHRTWTHTIWFVIAFGIGSIWFRPLIWLALGFFLHLFWDNFSRTGICFIYPIIKKRKHHPLKLYKSGSVSELVVVGCVFGFTCLSVFGIFYFGVAETALSYLTLGLF